VVFVEYSDSSFLLGQGVQTDVRNFDSQMGGQAIPVEERGWADVVLWMRAVCLPCAPACAG
jgi:hypothetical protein